MELNFQKEKPIYLQLSEWIADSILSQKINEEEQVPSTTEISLTYKVNPATALKGINLLVEKGIIYKKRGVGMFVSKGAVEILKKERQSEFYENYVKAMVDEARKLGIAKEDLIKLIERGMK